MSRIPKIVKMTDLTSSQQAVVQALIAADKSVKDNVPEKVTDPVALKKLAALFGPILKDEPMISAAIKRSRSND